MQNTEIASFVAHTELAPRTRWLAPIRFMSRLLPFHAAGITIDDVVYVVDCGKAKEKSYDPLNKLATLLPQWIAQVTRGTGGPWTLPMR